MDTDTPATEPGDFESVEDAAAAFAALLDAPPEEEKKEEPEPEKEPEPEPENNAVEEGADAPITIQVDGKPITLTASEWAEKYKADLRQADYTKKTMEVAEQKKSAQTEIQKTLQERANYAQNLTKMETLLQGAIEEQNKIDWADLYQRDPAKFVWEKHLLDQRQAALNQNRQEQAQLSQKALSEQAEAARAFEVEQREQLLAKLPEWKDPTKAETDREAIKEHLLTVGYTAKDVAGITDHRAVLLARDAMRYRQLLAKANAAEKKVEKAPTKVLQPGVSSDRSGPDGRTAAVKQFYKTGSVDDMAAVWRTLL